MNELGNQEVEMYLSAIPLFVVISLVIFGNGLVVIAVIRSSTLRDTPSNLFILSLATADMNLGLFVLPFSGVLQVLNTWVFGDDWCSIWLASDVLLCTASILNLCAISIDRYVAISRPLSYRSIITRKRAKLIILFVWFLASAISFPPLFGWTDRARTKRQDMGNSTYEFKNNTTSSFFNKSEKAHSEEHECNLVRDQSYVIYSALGSFYIPCTLLLFFYWRIFVVVRATTRSMRLGEMKIGRSHESMRVHRGGSKAPPKRHLNRTLEDNKQVTRNLLQATRTTENDEPSVRKLSVEEEETIQLIEHKRSELADNNESIPVRAGGTPRHNKGLHKPKKKQDSINCQATKKAHTFRKEAKAARTLSLVVSAFIACWAPFFTVYLTGAFITVPIKKIEFDIIFWLGYCNSILNPCIYAAFSRDFRRAFKNIICWSRQRRIRFKRQSKLQQTLNNSYGKKLKNDSEMSCSRKTLDDSSVEAMGFKPAVAIPEQTDTIVLRLSESVITSV